MPAGGALAASASGPHERIGFAPETIAPTAICRAFLFAKEGVTHDCVPDIARARGPDCDRGLARSVMSGEIIRFIHRPCRDCEHTDFPTIAFRAPIQPDDLPIERVEAEPCDHVRPEHETLV